MLLVENARLGQDLETQKLNLADINEFLTGELDKTSTKLTQLESRAGKLQQELDDLKESHVVRNDNHTIHYHAGCRRVMCMVSRKQLAE